MTDISIIILTKNEKLHSKRCLDKLAPLEARQIFVVDCFSDDGTQEIVESFSRAERVEHVERVEESGDDGRVEVEKGRRILLVTSAWHMKRARMMFEKYAPEIEVVCAPADFEQTMMSQNIFSPKAIVPDVNAFQLNSYALHEWIGIVGYKLFI